MSHAELAWLSSAIVLDVDDYAATLAYVRAFDGLAQIEETRTLPNFGAQAWKDRLVNAIADACVWQTRRDPQWLQSSQRPTLPHNQTPQQNGLFSSDGCTTTTFSLVVISVIGAKSRSGS